MHESGFAITRIGMFDTWIGILDTCIRIRDKWLRILDNAPKITTLVYHASYIYMMALSERSFLVMMPETTGWVCPTKR